MPHFHIPRHSVVTIDQGPRKSVAFHEEIHYDSDASDDDETPRGRHLNLSWLPCCMSEEDAETFGHHVSIFMVALVAFATFFCVTLILILVFLLG